MFLTHSFRLLLTYTFLLILVQSINAHLVPQRFSPFQPRQNGDPRVQGPIATGGIYADGFKKAKALIDTMTIEEKVNVTSGYSGKCVGFTGEVPSKKLRALCLQDGPTGVRPARRVSQFPDGVTTAATWDRKLIIERAEALASEFKAKGINIWLGPVTGGPLGRSPRGGRNFEGWSPDEYLTGVCSFLTVKHAQSNGLMTCAKHFIGYEQETFRNQYNNTEPYSVYPANGQDPISSDIDDRTTHELYLWGFAEAVRAATGAIMTSYNEVNGTHASSNNYTINHLLKTELGFQGPTITDWGGAWDTFNLSTNGGDVEMPGSAYDSKYGDFFGQELVDLVKNGSIPEARLDDQALRLLGTAMALQDLDTWPEPSFDVRDLTLPTNNVKKDHHKIIKKIGEESVTLLKNNRTGTLGLPFRDLYEMESIAVIGIDAGPNPVGDTACGQDRNMCNPTGNTGTLTAGGGSGWAIPPYIIDPLAAIQHYVRNGGPDVNINLYNDNLDNARIQAAGSEAALVFASAYSTEGMDRTNLTLFNDVDKVIQTVASVNNNTVIVIHGPGAVDVESWIEHPNITAVLFAYYPGQEGGNSLPPILWGEKSPSGKLPFTIGKSLNDYPPNTIVADHVVNPQANFSEALLIDYKWFDAKNITPRFEFGFGMSYSSFKYGQLWLDQTFEKDSTTIQKTNERFTQHGQGDSLYDILATAGVEITNTGKVEAAEVAQLYLTFPPNVQEPPKLLRGFEKQSLAPGETKSFKFPLRRKDLSTWLTEEQKWQIPKGKITLSVGSSSRQIHHKIEHTF